ncbi:MAG: HD domain-containing protein [bacterium]
MSVKQIPMNENRMKLAKEFASAKFAETGVKNHFLDVFKILQGEFNILDTDILIAGILHDILEDTSVTYEEMGEKFSKKVADMVQEVSHPKNYTREQKDEYYQKIKTISSGAKLIKMADFTSHLRDFIKIYERKEQHLYPKFVNNDKYIASIREFLDSCEDLTSKNIVYDLANALEQLL